MSFTDNEEKKLIKLVSEHPQLYDHNHIDYHNHLVKETTWQSIGQTLNKPGEECKRKWKFIRDGYIRYKKKSKFDPNHPPPKNCKKKRHKLLTFLEESGAVAITPAEPEVHIEETDDTSQENDEEYYQEDKNFTFVNTDKVKTECEEYRQQATKRQKVYDRLERDETILREREDDVDLFCRHIAEVLRNMPPLFKAKAKKHISEVVSDYEIKAAQSYANTSEVNQDDII